MTKKYKSISNKKAQTVLLQKVIVLEQDTFVIVGSGYVIHKFNGDSRLDAMDLKGEHLKPAFYSLRIVEEYLAYTTDTINQIGLKE